MIALNLFNCVHLEPEIQPLVWPNDAAYDPAALYHWRQGDGAELATRETQRDQQTVAAVNTLTHIGVKYRLADRRGGESVRGQDWAKTRFLP